MGAKDSTSSSSNTPPPQVLQAYQQTVNQAQNVASQPYTPYSGAVVAGFNPTQQAAFSNVNSAAGLAQPYVQQAANLVGAATSGINPTATLGQFESPYTQQVVGATQNQFNLQNQQQSSALTGNAVAQGAYGGDRSAVAQAQLAGQQQTAQAPVIANLENTGYNNALQTGLQTQEANAWLNSQGAFALGQLGSEAQGEALQGAQAQLATGSQQQQQAQTQLNVPEQAYQQAQAYPFQTTNWLAGITEGLGSQEGGTSSTTQPDGNTLSSLAGLGLAGASLFAKRGGAIAGFDAGGTVPDLSVSFIPGASSPTGRNNMPAPPHAIQQPNLMQTVSGDLALVKGFGGQSDQPGLGQHITSYMNGNGWNGFDGGMAKAAMTDADMAGAETSDWMPADARGGFIRRDDGGSVAGFGGAGGVSPMMQAGLGSGNPMVSGLVQRYQQMPTEQLRELSARYGTGSPQGQMVQTMLMRRQMMPQSDPTQQAQAQGTQAALQPQQQPQAGFAARGGVIHRDDGGSVPDDSTLLVPPIPPADGPPPVAGLGSAPAPTSSGTAGFGATNDPYAVKYTPRSGGDPQEVQNIRDNDLKMSLLQAGLAMAAGHSPHALQNIGAGALAGAKNYQSEQQRADALQEKQGELADQGNYRLADLSLNSQRAKDAMTEAQARIDQEKAALAETSRFHSGQLGMEGARLAQERDLAMTEAQARIDQEKAALAETSRSHSGQLGMEGARLAQERDLAMTPPELRIANAVAKMSPEDRASFSNYQAVQKGQLPIYTADQFRTSAATPSSGTTGSLVPDAGTGDKFLQTLPVPLQPVIKGIAEGRTALPARMTPQTQQMLELVEKYDPTFDATDYNKRNRTATDFSSAGQSGKAVGAINTAMAHLDALDKNFDALSNSDYPTVNAIKNWWETQTGSPAPNNATQARDAVANELRKVFATTGGGGLEELRGWQDRFPINGSPQQQKEAIRSAIELMDGRMAALANNYSVGMGTNHTGADLLSPEARAAYLHLKGVEPASDQARAPTYAQPGGGAQPAQQPQQPPTLAAPPPMNQRQVGATYWTPRGLMKWQGTGWQPVAQ